MFSLFCQFLVVKIFELIQQSSREKCNGCQNHFRFDSLHDCMKTTIQDRIKMFFPESKNEVLNKLDRLLGLFQQSFTLNQSPDAYLQVGETFLNKLLPNQIVDRRFINEDSELMFTYDQSWQEDVYDQNWQEDNLSTFCQEIFGDESREQKPCLPKITKRKEHENVHNNDPTEVIADTPKRKYKKRIVTNNY